MKQNINLIIVLGLLGFTWGFGAYVYPLFQRAEAYVLFVLSMVGIFWIFRKKLGLQYLSLGIMGIILAMVFFVLTSPHRVARVKSWLSIFLS